MSTNVTGFYRNSKVEELNMAAVGQSKVDKIIFAERVAKVDALIKDSKWYAEFKMILGYYLPNHPYIELFLDAISEPHTNGKAIWAGMPQYIVEREKPLTDVEIYASLRAILAHEAQHIRSSNFKAYAAYIEHIVKYFGSLDVKYQNPGYQGVLQHVATSFGNGIEDGRIERITVYNRPGLTKYFRYFRAEWWKSQPVTQPNDNLSTFLWSIVTLATTGMYPLNFIKFYAGTEVEKELNRIEADVILATNTRTAEDCLKACYRLIQNSEALLRKWIDEIPVNTLQNMPTNVNHEYTTSEDDEFNEQAPQQSSMFDNSNAKGKEDQDKKDDQKGQGGSGEQQDQKQDQKDSQSGSDGKESDKKEDAEKQAGGSNGQGKDDKKENASDQGKDGDKEDKKQGEKSSSNSDLKGSDKSSEGNEDASEKGEDGKEKGKKDKAAASKSPIQNMEPHLSATESYGQEGMQEDPKDGERLDEVNKMIQDILNDVKQDFEQTKNSINDKEERSLEKSRSEATSLSKEELKEIMNKSGFGYRDITLREGSGAKMVLPQEIQYRAKRFAKEVKWLLDSKVTPTKRNQTAGMIDPLKLYKLGMKDTGIMKKNGRKSLGDYVAYFIKDESASMNSSKRTSAGIALSIAEEALKPLIPLKITSYTTSNNGVVHRLIKDFKDQGKRSYSYTDLVNNSTGNGNADGVAIRTATEELLKHGSKDKLLFIFSDGVPSAYGKQSVGLADVKAAVTEAKRKGIRVFCIMFGTKTERESLDSNFQFMYGNDFISVDPNEIEKVLKTRLMKALVK
ncbi:VWA domain-containing protein [Lysinibacillus sp. UGB7]|uniref:VWA domain-containing protein n=1 Tax=Lysinibacillus sp. UGB7 TaxID=3411039 RepID=UPI003B7B1A03